MLPPGTSDISDKKIRLRGEAKARRSALTGHEREVAAEAVARHGLGFLRKNGLLQKNAAPVVSGFLAIGEEIDPAPLMAGLQADGCLLALPVMVGKSEPLAFRTWSPGAPLVARMWGIREPGPEAPLLEPDVLLVPLLAFDRTGHRLGYGGGYYDRTLRDLRRRRAVLAVGLAFSCQVVDAVPHLDYDERLDWVLTPEGPISCQS